MATIKVKITDTHQQGRNNDKATTLNVFREVL